MATIEKVVLKKDSQSATVYTTDKVDALLADITGGSGTSLSSLKASLDAQQKNLENHNQSIVNLNNNLTSLTTEVGTKMTKSEFVGEDGKILAEVLPSYVDDVLEYTTLTAFPKAGETGKIYVALDTNKTYRWGGTSYVIISDTLAIGETAGTAYAGNKGAANAKAISELQTGKANKSEIPTKVSQLENDSEYSTIGYVKDSFSEYKATFIYNGQGTASYTYNDISNAFNSKNPTITASVSETTITFNF